MQRYSTIKEKNPREILLLRGNGCKWRKCAFCDYHLDFCRDDDENFKLNKEFIDKVSGVYKKLEVVNSGSFCDLDEKTLFAIEEKCVEKGIDEIHFECHWIHRNEIPLLRKRFDSRGISVKMKIGVETFDYDFREKLLLKGLNERNVEKISELFDEVCLLFGISGQTESSMRSDIETGLKYFERVCINVMCKNTTRILPDDEVINEFVKKVLPDYIASPRVDILIENTDFGVGGE